MMADKIINSCPKITYQNNFVIHDFVDKSLYSAVFTKQ
jgi:hypothetical protein